MIDHIPITCIYCRQLPPWQFESERCRRKSATEGAADRLQRAALAFASTISTPDPICGVEPALSHLEAAARAFAVPLPSGAAALRQAIVDAVQAGEWHHSDPNNAIDAAIVALQYEIMEAGGRTASHTACCEHTCDGEHCDRRAGHKGRHTSGEATWVSGMSDKAGEACGARRGTRICIHQPGHPGPHTASDGYYWNRAKHEACVP